MEICNQEQELIDVHSDNLWAMYMQQGHGLQYKYTDVEYSGMYAALAEISLERKNDDNYNIWGRLFINQVEIIVYPTEEVTFVEYP